MAKNELKKCPCCKGPAIYNEDLNSFYAECHHCQLRTASYRTKERAAEIWNTRILEAELKQHEWRKVEESVPEVGDYIMVYNSRFKIVTDLHVTAKTIEQWSRERTHWKPITLPEVE